MVIRVLTVMGRFAFTAALLAAALPVAAPAATIETISGVRGASITYFQPIGQSFTAIDSQLTSIGFQFQSLNPDRTNDPITLTIRAYDSAAATWSQGIHELEMVKPGATVQDDVVTAIIPVSKVIIKDESTN